MSSRWRRGLCGAAAAALGLVLATAGPAPAATGISGCPWIEFTRLPGLSTYPDSNTRVYQCVYAAGPLHQTVLEGRPPKARFWSLAVLDQARRELDTLSDGEIARRPDGSYRVVVRDGCGATPNCLDVSGGPVPLLPGLIYYRVYVPPLLGLPSAGPPTVRYEATSGAGAPVDAHGPSDALASYVDLVTSPLAPGGMLAELLAGPSGLDRPATGGGEAPEVTRFHGLGQKQLSTLENLGLPAPVVDVVRTVLGQGGFGATRDNAYVTVGYDMTKGDVVLRAKAPTYRAQSPAPANGLGRDDGSEQVRYWSLCTTQATRTVDCVRDEQVPLDADGAFDVVVAPSCPVAGHRTCLRSGVLGTAGPAALGTLVYRNTLAAPGFYTEDGPATCPGPEAMYCGDYAPRATYVARP